MNKEQSSQKQRDFSETPISYAYKPIEKTGVTKAIFASTLKTQQQHEHQQNPSLQQKTKPINQKIPTNRIQNSTPFNLKQSHYTNQQQSQQRSKFQQKIQFLQCCMNEYKLEALSMYSKLTERERFYKEAKEKYDTEILYLKDQVSGLQKEIQGQAKLIQQCHQKYDTEVKQHELCLKLINEQKALIQDLNMQINSLQRAVNSTREVSVNLIKQNQNLKAEILIEREKYELLFQDYNELAIKSEKELKEMYEENRVLIRKLDDMDVEIKIYQKDKEIQSLLIYEDSIQKRQKQMFNPDQNSSSPPSVKIVQGQIHSPYQYLPRRLNFQDQSGRSNKKRPQQTKPQPNPAQTQIIELQKSKISHLQTQLKQLQKRNKELQSLMVKFMK